MRAVLASAVIVGFGVGLGSAWMLGASWRQPQTGNEPALRAGVDAARAALDGDDVLERLNQATRRIAAAVEPSVVHIQVEVPQAATMRRVSYGQGSGWVWDDGGHIITNAHVVADAQTIRVQLHDGRTVIAQRVGADPATDIAVIKIEPGTGLIAARRASTEPARRGDRVYAFGSPFGFKFSMNEGIVSGLSRDPSALSNRDQYTNFIQSDAAVNPGHSGGPLVDVRGRVVGMNVAIATGRAPQGDRDRRGADEAVGQSAGISFAIPLETIEPVVSQLIQTGTVAKGFLGINMPVTEEDNLARLKDRAIAGQGVIVTGVLEPGPASRAGMREGDVITRVNDMAVSTVTELRARIATTLPGQQIRLRIDREGAPQDLAVTLADLVQERARMVVDAMQKFGVTKYQEGDGGVMIVAVRSGSPADRLGLKRGLVFKQINGELVESAAAFESLLSSSAFVRGGPALALLTSPEGEEKELLIRGQQ